jgi:hypothetical protein
MQKMSDIWSVINTWYLHRIQGAQQYSTVAYISNLEVGVSVGTAVTVLAESENKLRVNELYVADSIKKGISGWGIVRANESNE